MNKNEKFRSIIKSMIQEAVSHRIKQIDEAGDIAATDAKIAKIDEEYNRASKITDLLEKINLQHYIGEKLYNKIKEEMTKSIEEYGLAKSQLEEKKNGGKVEEKNKKKVKKEPKEDKGDKEELLEWTNILNGDHNKKINKLVKQFNLELQHSANQKHSDINNKELYSDILKNGKSIAKYYYKIGKLEYPNNGEFDNITSKFDFS